MLVQVAKEERGNKGAALTTYLSLAGRYCVLMPNTPRGGGVSRKITSISDRRRLKELLNDLEVPDGMGVIVRTAGGERSKAEIKRDFEYLLRLWDEIRDLTLKSTAPALIYEEGNLIKRSIRDLYARDIDEVHRRRRGRLPHRQGLHAHADAEPCQAGAALPRPAGPLFHRFQVESQIDAIHSPVVQLRSGGYIVINQTEALVAIDVNSGRSTRERNIEETALKTNLEAADEIARQLRLRDLAGLIVIDFIDMEEHRHNARSSAGSRMRCKNDRARIQVGRISPFGLLEMSRQRLRPSLVEASTQPCPHCGGTGLIRSTESTALHVLRAIEEEGMRRRSAEISVYVPTAVALYMLNQKRDSLGQIEARYGMRVTVDARRYADPARLPARPLRAFAAGEAPVIRLPLPPPPEIEDEDEVDEAEDAAEAGPHHAAENGEGRPRERGDDERAGRRRRRRRGRRGDGSREPRPTEVREPRPPEGVPFVVAANGDDRPQEARHSAAEGVERDADGERRRRRRGRRGGRWRNREGAPGENGAHAENGAPGENGTRETRIESASEVAEDLVEAAIEGAQLPAVEAGGEEPPPAPIEANFAQVEARVEEPPPPPVEPEMAEAEAIVEAAVESAEIPASEPERELATVGAPKRVRASRAKSAPKAAPVLVDVHTVTEKPESPRRGWWQRLTQP